MLPPEPRSHSASCGGHHSARTSSLALFERDRHLLGWLSPAYLRRDRRVAGPAPATTIIPGALRDMVQNHLTQLLTLVAMEVPTSFSSEAIRNEKIKVLKSIQPLDIDNVVRGRYTRGDVRGETIPGYLESEGVADDSTTETFVALKMFVDSWRWQGVPFFLRTGKCLPRKTTQITVRFRRAPVSFFNRMGCDADTSDVLTITLQPNEGFTFYLDIKKPSSSLELERYSVAISIRYALRADDAGRLQDAVA